MSASMAEVLRQVNKDHGHVHTYRGGAQGCRCGQRDPNSIGTNSWIWGHVAQVGAEQLAANGYGKLEDAKAAALREAALELMNVSEHPLRMPGIRFAVGFLGGARRPE